MRLQGLLRGQRFRAAAPAKMAVAQLKRGPPRQRRGVTGSQAALAQPTAVAAGQQAQAGTRSRIAFTVWPLQLRMFGSQVTVIQHHLAAHRAANAGRPLADPLHRLDPPVTAQQLDYRDAFHAKPSR